MDLKKDEQFQQYYASMTASPSYSSSSNDTSSPEQENYYNNGNYNNLTSAENNGDDYFYEATEQKENDTYTDDDEDDAETEEEENEEGMDEEKGTTEFHNDEDAETEEEATSTAVVEKKKKKRKKRDPNKPKGFVCASLKYANANRQRVKDANPNASFQEVARMLSADYKALSKKDSKVWIKLALDDRARYKKEMLSYVPPPPSPPTQKPIAQISGGTTYSASTKEEDNDLQMIAVQAPKSKRQKSDSPKRPRTSWQLFSSSRAHQIIKTQHPDCDCNEIQRILGQQWRGLTDEERAPLLKMEKADVERYNRELAEYKAREIAEYPDVVDV